MEKQPQHRSIIGSALKGFAYSGFTGALMAGIFLGVSAALAFATGGASLPLIGTLGSATTLGSALGTMLVVGLSTGIFGGLIQGFSANHHQQSMQAAAYSPSNGRDIAITAVSQNLYSPKLQAALDRVNQQEQAQEASMPESTTFRDRIGQRTNSLNEALNRRLTSSGTSHTQRLQQEREAQAPASPTLQ